MPRSRAYWVGLGCSCPTILCFSLLALPLASEKMMPHEPGPGSQGCRGAERVLAFQLKRELRTTRSCWTTLLPSSLRVRSLWCGWPKLCSGYLNPDVIQGLSEPSSSQVPSEGSPISLLSS